MVDHDFASLWHAIINTNWSAGIITKPSLILARGQRKTRKKHTTNTIYFYTHRRFDPNVLRVTRDYNVIIPVEIVGTTLSNHDDMIDAYDDATAEHLDDAGRAFHGVRTVWTPHVKTRPRNRFVSEGETYLTVFAETIIT